MSSHLLLAIEDKILQTIELEMLYEVASHEFADAMADLSRGAPERSVFVVHGHDQKSL
jgi:hypothetical protein